MFSFLDCKSVLGEDDSSMHEGSECEQNLAPPSSVVERKTENEIPQVENLNNSND